MNQDVLKTLVSQAALDYVEPGSIIGVGTGSTVNKFIDALAGMKQAVAGAVSSSLASTERLRAIGIPVLEANEVSSLSVYIDGADEINPEGVMIKGGGAALTREKIVAALAEKFICIADSSKWVEVLGAFPLPVEVLPMAVNYIQRKFSTIGGKARLRLIDGEPLRTDNGQYILDVEGLRIEQPRQFEAQVSQWPGVVTVGVFAYQKADVCLLASQDGVKKIVFEKE